MGIRLASPWNAGAVALSFPGAGAHGAEAALARQRPQRPAAQLQLFRELGARTDQLASAVAEVGNEQW